MLSSKVILLSVTNLSDARYAAGMGVDYIGFSINPVSNNYVTAKDVKAITDWLSGVSVIGDIGSSMPMDSDYSVDYLLTNNPGLVSELEEPILSLELTEENKDSLQKDLERLNNEVSFFILKVDPADLEFLFAEIGVINQKFDCYLSTEFNSQNIGQLLATKPQGIVLYGTHEEKPGLSNYDGIADVLELLDEI